MFWFGIVVTILWLTGICVAVYLSGKDVSTMDLNEIGDALAGAFAPIAFLWLFIATWMQRIELGLQRQELADTREVLREQREELQRSVEESNRQTGIMQRTLEATQSRDIYDEFRLLLYYLAKYVTDYYGKRLLYLKDEKDISQHIQLFAYSADPVDGRRLFDRSSNGVVTEQEHRIIDDLFHDMLHNLGLQITITSDILSDMEEYRLQNHRFEHFLGQIIARLKGIVKNESYRNVPLVVARMEALELELLLERLEAIQSEIKDALWPQPLADSI